MRMDARAGEHTGEAQKTLNPYSGRSQPIKVWSDNLLVPIAVHALYDFFALSYLLRSYRLNPRYAIKEVAAED